MAKTAAKKLPPSPRPKKVDAKAPRTPVKAAPVPVKAAKPAKAAAPAPAPKRQKPPVVAQNDDLHTWHGLQEALREARTSAEVQSILNHEIAGPARLRWMLRMQGRLSALRSIEEVAHLESIAKE